MSQKKEHSRSGLVLLIAIGFYFVVTVAYTLYAVQSEKREMITELDHDLLNAARSIPLLLESGFFERATKPGGVSEAEDQRNIDRLTLLADSLKVAYLYTLADIDGTVYITSSSASAEEQREHTEVRYFTAYSEMEAKARETIISGKPHFRTYTDRWGAFRHVYIPLRNEQGIPYVLAADQHADTISAQLPGRVAQMIAVPLFFILAAIPFFIAYRIQVHRQAANLRESEERFNIAADAGTIGVWEFDIPNQKLVWDSRMFQLYGIAPDEFTGAYEVWHGGVHPDDRQRAMDEVTAAIAGGKPFNTEFRIIRPDGEIRHIRAFSKVIRAKDGPPVRMIGTNQDVTEQRETKEKLRFIIENSTNMFYSHTPDQVLTYVSPNVKDILGYDEEEVAIRWTTNLVTDHPANVRGKRLTEEAIRSGKAQPTYELQLLHKEGHPVWVEVSESPVVENGKTIALVGSFTDITERKQVQARLLHSEKMDAIGHLAGGVAHDFNNQLSGVLGYGDMLVKRLDDPNLLRYAENICAAARRSADLTQKLLAFARKGQFQHMPVEMHKVIQETVEMLHHSIDKRIAISQQLNAQKTTVDGDPSQLQNALLNLAINACDAMPDGGTLTFTTDVMELDQASAKAKGIGVEDGQYLVMSVMDTGSGIPDDVLLHVFEPFYTTKDQGEGTGMGLASVYGAVTQHKGDISVTSVVGQGSNFTVFLPLSDAVVKNPTEQLVPTAPGKALNILVVDDEEMVRELGCDILTSMDHSVISAADGQEAVDLYRDKWEEINLVVLDMVMPRLSGHETFVEMKRINPKIKAILASGYSLNDESQAILNEGVLAFVQKPFDQSSLMASIQRVMGD